jgi:hypothetical protein
MGLADYSTQPGECYEGEIVAAQFMGDSGFDNGVRLQLTIDARALGRGEENAAVINTSDGMFVDASVRQMEQLVHDSLWLFQFPGGRWRNFLAHALPAAGDPALIVVSLMENEDVEVRILRPALSAGEVPSDGNQPLFGIFRLQLKDGCGR